MIFGIPGSGKSTVAVKLSGLLHLPVFHLDRYFFIEGWKERDYEEFLKIQKELAEQESWIIDGNATRSLEIRFHELNNSQGVDLFVSSLRVSFVPLQKDHMPLLVGWLKEPHVAKWWDEGQSWTWRESSRSLAALDFYLGDPTYLGRGIGAIAIWAFLENHVYKHFLACLVDPDKENVQAIKTYGKAGFKTYHAHNKSQIMIARKDEEL
jgi:hypothetical protein